jgi:gamma-D-glutamyl-L-lysine dipeptidyl-peptidase
MMDRIDYGVCRLSVVVVRKEPADVSEQVTQLLFGDHYEVQDATPDKKWLKIQIHFDQYVGWIDAKQHHAISKEYYDYVNYAEFKISTDMTSSLLYNKSPLIVLCGSIIPISGAELFKMEEQFAFNGETKSVGQKREFDFLKTIAVKYLNAPYQWGGKNPFGIDCSGFTQMVFKICGYRLFRDSSQQSTQGKSIKTFADIKPGDLAFFKNPEGKIVHTGIVLEQDKIIHASGKVRIDQLTEEGIFNAELKTTTHKLGHFRRILSE